MKPANYAPVYAGLYPELAEIARSHGYAMAVHGSMARDADLICIPWIEDAAEPQAVVDEITGTFAIQGDRKDPRTREHGRLVYTLTIAGPGCFIDLSFMPRTAVEGPSVGTKPQSGLVHPNLGQELREKVEIVTEWLAMAKETPPTLHSSLNYVPISPSEFDAIDAILAALQHTEAGG